MANIKDIAKQCGVNPATVSRALNGQKGVSENVRSNILKTARKLGYSKNPLAASLITKKSGLIGLVVPDITNPYYAQVAKGVSSILEKQGYAIFLCDSDRQPQIERHYFEMLCNYRVEGVILMSVTATEEDLEIFLRNQIKVICVDNPISKKYSSVCNDNYQGACDLIEHLVLSAKVRRLVALMGTAEANTTKQRLRGCIDTLTKLNCRESLIEVLHITPTYQGGLEAASELEKLNADSVFCINDSVALGVFSYCQQHQIKVPQQLKIAGYDDLAEASMISVPLTTVHQRKYVLGQKAASQLLSELSNPLTTPIKIELLPQLKIRKSCGEDLS
ncbi:MAG: LacI family transcriptional regulator [Succinivibrio sp.]|nr:LacI family transcriptional regulator [Succinivibrio sp.]